MCVVAGRGLRREVRLRWSERSVLLARRSGGGGGSQPRRATNTRTRAFARSLLHADKRSRYSPSHVVLSGRSSQSLAFKQAISLSELTEISSEHCARLGRGHGTSGASLQF